MRFRIALSQRDAQHKARQQRNWATKSLQGEAGELGNESHNKSQERDWVTPIATTSRGREDVPKGETREGESHNKARQRSCITRSAATSRGRGIGQLLVPQKCDSEELCHIEIHNTNRLRRTRQQSHSKARQENWETKATTSRTRGTG
jgi:hypothetical protein